MPRAPASPLDVAGASPVAVGVNRFAISGHSPAAEHDPDRLEHDADVEPYALAPRVLDVEADHLLVRPLVAAADLPQAGEARAHGEAVEVPVGIGVDLVADDRARTDERHLAAHDVPQLR